MKIRLITESDSTQGLLPVGTEIEHPDAWMHCLPGYGNSPAIAVPVDDEARARVAAELEARRDKLQALQAIIRKPKSNDPKMVAHVREMEQAYAQELDALPPAAT